MSIPKRLPLKLGQTHVAQAPPYWSLTDDGYDEPVIALVDPQEHYTWLRTHQVGRDGTVTPTVNCPVHGCDFHHYIKLEGWGK